MQFKYPELLWALLLLVIPIIIHLFQLRRFKKTAFTNVKLLKKVVSESRKSSTLKKWLLLFARLGLITSLVLAFAQPFTADAIALQKKEHVFYLDNSFSMQAKAQGSTLLQNTIQDFIKNVPEGEIFTLFTNDNVFRDVEIQDIKNDLLQLPISSNQLTLEEILLTTETYFKKDAGSSQQTVILSDFQKRMGEIPSDTIQNTTIHFIKPVFGAVTNVAIDSIYLGAIENSIIELTAELSANEHLETTAVSLYNDDKLIAKTAAKFNENKKATVNFSIPANEAILGKIVLSDNGLSYDNQFYFNLDTPEKIKVLTIGDTDSSYLSRIFTPEDFDFSSVSLKQLNYGTIGDYNLIVLNELEAIPAGLSTALQSFTDNGGHITLIPAVTIDLNSYNQLASAYFKTRYTTNTPQEIAVAKVMFDHPLFVNVFEKSVTNFQYPNVKSHYSVSTTASSALQLQNNAPFLFGRDNAYFFTASLSELNSNFKNSPLIVPSFYNMGRNSLKLPTLYSILGDATTIEIPVSLAKDNILKLVRENQEFIPQQKLLPKKVQLSFKENPTADGIYQIQNNGSTLQNMSFNHNRKESDLSYSNLQDIPEERLHQSVALFFEKSQRANHISEFWKWFVILALLFVILETIFQRLFK